MFSLPMMHFRRMYRWMMGKRNPLFTVSVHAINRLRSCLSLKMPFSLFSWFLVPMSVPYRPSAPVMARQKRPHQACAVPWKNFLCCGTRRHAAACFYLHMWVPTHLWEIELTNKRPHPHHCWAESITFTIRIVCSGFVDAHHSQMAQTVVAHMQTVLCLDVAHQTERLLNMASRAWSSEEQQTDI